jgi:hypothetical protein
MELSVSMRDLPKYVSSNPEAAAAAKRHATKTIFFLLPDCFADAWTMLLRFGGTALFDAGCFILARRSARRLMGHLLTK